MTNNIMGVVFVAGRKHIETRDKWNLNLSLDANVVKSLRELWLEETEGQKWHLWVGNILVEKAKENTNEGK
jgi:hypothetical protein